MTTSRDSFPVVWVGNLRVRLYAYTPSINRLVQQFLDFFPSLTSPRLSEEEWSLTIISSSASTASKHRAQSLKNDRETHTKLRQAWCGAQRQSPRPRQLIHKSSLFSASGSSPSSWDGLWDLVVGRYQFLWQDCECPGSFFYLAVEHIRQRPDWRLFSCILTMASWWHVLRGGARLHGAAVADGHRGFLFLGQSGAGKSTLASLSDAAGKCVIGDDTVFLVRDGERGYSLAAAPRASSRLVAPPKLQPFLQGVFVLVKDDVDCLIPLSRTLTARALSDGFLTLSDSPRLPRAVVQQAFQNICQTAREIPGYELHFRKTSDFWELINAEFPVDDN